MSEKNEAKADQFDPLRFQQSKKTIQTVSPLISRGSWGKKRPDYSAYTEKNTQRALAAACRARKLSSCGSKIQLVRRLSASGVTPHLVKEMSLVPDWRKSYNKKPSGAQRNGSVFLKRPLVSVWTGRMAPEPTALPRPPARTTQHSFPP